MSITLYQIDAFTSQPFAGNPAAVCLLDAVKPDEWMQKLAQEMNLSDTAFLLAEGDEYRLRWFTPQGEMDLCGHATLASAHFLWETGRIAKNAVARFNTRSGLLTARQDDGWIEMDFPATPPEDAEAPADLALLLGIPGFSYVGRSPFDYLVEVNSAQIVRSAKPDLARLKQVEARGFILTSMSDDPTYDFVSRFFAPAAGIDEDPVTGSAHSCLVPYWHKKLGKKSMTAYQASARGGVLRLQSTGERVIIRGQAVTVFEAQLRD